jgi:xylan 1,4-beta-xylosidase
LFARLGRRRVAVDAPSMIPVDAIIGDGVRAEPDLGAVASLDEAGSKLTILLWNYHDVAGGHEDRREVRLAIKGLKGIPRHARTVEYSIDEHSGNAYAAWLAMGSPQPPSAEQIAKLHAAAKMHGVARELTRTSAGDARLLTVLPRQSVKLVEIDLARPR